MVSLRQALDHAAGHGYGAPAFNVHNLEQIQAIMEAAQETGSPVLLQPSAGARKTPAGYDYNVEVTHKGCEIAHAVGSRSRASSAVPARWRAEIATERGEFDPRKALAAARRAARGICKARFEAFGCAGQASRIRPLPLEQTLPRYA